MVIHSGTFYQSDFEKESNLLNCLIKNVFQTVVVPFDATRCNEKSFLFWTKSLLQWVFSVGLRSSFLCLVLDSLSQNCASITSTIINQSFNISAPEKKYHFFSSIWMSNQANHNKIVLKWNKKIGEISSSSCNKRKSICFLMQNQG